MNHKRQKRYPAAQIRAAEAYLRTSRDPARNRAILLLHVRAGLRGGDIAELTWDMVTDGEGRIADRFRLPKGASKRQKRDTAPLDPELRDALERLRPVTYSGLSGARVIHTQRLTWTSAKAITNMLARWFDAVRMDDQVRL